MKYEITNRTNTVRNPITNEDITVYQIKYLKDIDKHNIKNGDLGGWVEKNNNLSQEGDCVITGETVITGEAYIYGDVVVYASRIHGVTETLTDMERVLEISGTAKLVSCFVVGSPHIFDNALLLNSIIKNNPKIYGNAVVSYSEVSDITHIFDNSILTNLKILGSKRINNICTNKQSDIETLFADI